MIIVKARDSSIFISIPIELNVSHDDRAIELTFVTLRPGFKTRGPWATTLTWMYSYDGYIQPKYCKCCVQEKINLSFAMATNQTQQFGLNSYSS